MYFRAVPVMKPLFGALNATQEGVPVMMMILFAGMQLPKLNKFRHARKKKLLRPASAEKLFTSFHLSDRIPKDNYYRKLATMQINE